MTIVENANVLWINYSKFRADDGAIEPGQIVMVYHPGSLGTREKNVRRRVLKVSTTQITLDDGYRYNVITGDQIGSFGKSQSRPRIVQVKMDQTT